MWIAMAFLSAIFAAFTAILSKIGVKNINSNLATAIRTGVVLAFAWVMVLITGEFSSITSITGKAFIFLIFSGLATGLSWLSYFKALSLGNVNKVSPVDKSSAFITIIFSFLLFGDKFTPISLIAIIIMIVGTVLMYEKKSDDKENKHGWFFFAMMSAIFASLTSILAKYGLQDVSSNLATAIRTIVVFVFAWGIVFAKGEGKEIKSVDKKSLLFLVLSGFATGASWLCYYNSLQNGKLSAVVSIDKLSVVFTLFLSLFILKEKINKKALFGIILIVISIFLLIL